ncbi:VWA domain-containing protein [Planctomycetota bacterium]
MSKRRIFRTIQDFTGRARSKAMIPAGIPGQGYQEPTRPSYGYRNSIIIIDVSPSMELRDWKPSRLDAALESAKTFVTRLYKEEPAAKVGIVTYHRKAETILGLTKVKDYLYIQKAIDSIRTGSATNIGAGLAAAMSILGSHRGTNQVVLLSDGFHNCGSDPRPIADRLKKHAVIECVGIGGSPKNVDEKLLKYIASTRPDGSKRYRWIGDKGELVQHFHDLAGRLVRA